MDRHETDPVALLFGIAAMAVGGIFFFGGEVGSISTEWILPSVMIAIGLGVGAFALNSLSRRKDHPLAVSETGMATVPEPDADEEKTPGEL